MTKIDACGLSCPQPVVLTMNAVNKGQSDFEVMVDNNTACENVKRFGENKGFNVSVKKEGDDKILLGLSK